MTDKPFTVEPRNDGECFVIRPLGVCISFFPKKADAEIMARYLNAAYARGRSDLQSEMRNLLNVSGREVVYD